MKKYIVLSLLFALSVLSYGAVTRQGGRQLWKEHQETVVKIAIDDSKIDAALTNFPVLVKLTSSNFNWTKTANDGRDVYFRDSNGGMLKYDRERHDKTNSVGEYWVKVSSIPDAASFFYMVYGDSSRTDEADRTNVWDGSFMMVQHMADSTTSRTADATSNGNFGTKLAANEPIEATGKIGKAQTFDGSDDKINIGNAASLQLTNLTLSAWIKSDIATAYHIIGKRDFATSGSPGFFVGNGKLDFYATNLYDRFGNTTILTATWYYVAVTLDMVGPTVVAFYLNGSADGTNTSASTVMGTNPWGIGCGNGNAADQPMDGLIDEVRISNVVRSAAWIKAEYYTGVDSLLTFTKVR